MSGTGIEDALHRPHGRPGDLVPRVERVCLGSGEPGDGLLDDDPPGRTGQVEVEIVYLDDDA